MPAGAVTLNAHSGHDLTRHCDPGAAHRYRCRVSEIPWWGLPLVAAVFALVGAGLTVLVIARNNYVRGRVRKTRRWYSERKDAYITLLAVFERDIYRLRAGYAAGTPKPDALAYLDEVGPALMQVRLLASGPVRSAALSVHKVLEQLHGPGPEPVPETTAPFLELLGHAPLLMQEFEVAIRDELEIAPTPPRDPLNGATTGQRRSLARNKD
ncbi:MAG: hypothetical protein QOE51_2694 [Actinoplanes sp.]|nr:hypothetical protein [Actinoplanes sp.]